MAPLVCLVWLLQDLQDRQSKGNHDENKAGAAANTGDRIKVRPHFGGAAFLFKSAS